MAKKSQSTGNLVQRGIEFQKTAGWTFDLGQFRWDAAAMCKYMIRAREKAEPNFLGSTTIYSRWGLLNISDDHDSCDVLLSEAQAASRKIYDAILAMGGSGGVRPDDPPGAFKCRVAGFVAGGPDIDNAISLARSGNERKILWNKVAAWADLPSIRDVLDHMPEKEGNLPHDPCSPASQSQQKDGPVTPDAFQFKGILYSGLQPIPFSLVSFLWRALNNTAKFAALSAPVWRDPAFTPGVHAIRSAAKQANRFFQKKTLPFRIRVLTRHHQNIVQLVGTTAVGNRTQA
jgi:hypothetical protein